LNDSVVFATVAHQRYGKDNRKTDKPEDLPEQRKTEPTFSFPFTLREEGDEMRGNGSLYFKLFSRCFMVYKNYL